MWSSASISWNYDLDCFSSSCTPRGSDSAGSNSGDAGGSNERINIAIRRSRSDNYTAPLERFKTASLYIFSTSRSRGHAAKRLGGVSRIQQRVSHASNKNSCRKLYARKDLSKNYACFYLFIHRHDSILCSDGSITCRKSLGVVPCAKIVRFKRDRS